MNHKFPYKWYLKDGFPAKNIEKHNLKVFGTFICGGGSSMGYKLAGYNHLGGVEIDKQIAPIYKINHNPKYLYNEDIRTFRIRNDLPEELFNIDILDGSPPCSVFSLAGKREEGWGIEKTFREGQYKQSLDDLFFEYIALAKRLQPKVVIAENVKGMLIGNAKIYCKKIKEVFIEAGYEVQLFLLNAATMGVPQKRERVFFIARRKDLKLPELKLSFNEKQISLQEVEKNLSNIFEKPTPPAYANYWLQCKQGQSIAKFHPKGSFFNTIKLHKNEPMPTIATKKQCYMHYAKPFVPHDDIFKLCGAYALDYNFLDIDPVYLIAMSVPPVVMAQISHQIYLQWFKK